ncbi:lanthionine synthetase LanC family protein [Hymenobacter metallicola]|uniref:Lanthionine synthetase C-like protein n=1 Tax=Hymenobacter metallicola TaxID=2563114 RepID=A0A4Z0PTN4_9BACT|nr:lanthionine synthetase LanC family protein [Hymenobacter metallicola]TGE21088.1 hypothetical protein E5K02_24050 [Hymenobacter metallicola]
MVKPYLLSTYKDKDSLVNGWRDIHLILANTSRNSSTVAELLGYTIYYYALYRAFHQEQDALRAQELLGQLLLLLPQQLSSTWTLGLLDEVVTLAWLHAELVEQAIIGPDKAASLAELDRQLLTEASVLLGQRQAGSRPGFLRIVRYFQLRLPGQLAPAYWGQVLELLEKALADQTPSFWFSFAHGEDVVTNEEGLIRLGLADGLAGELLLLIRLTEAGGQLPQIQQRVQQGIVYLLAAKREVDFSEKKYAIFPSLLAHSQQEAIFSNELSWSNGDMGQALLLYRGHQLLQDAELVRLAELVGLNTLLRTDVRSTGITNSSFSSGAAGVAQLYRALYQLSGHEAYRKGYTFWLTQTRSWLTHDLTNDFYHQHEGNLLHGLVGVGLVLLSAISEQDLRWDRLVL